MDLEVIGGKALMILLKHIYLHELQLTVFIQLCIQFVILIWLTKYAYVDY